MPASSCYLLPALFICLSIAACAPAQVPVEPEEIFTAEENLHSVLWVQTSAEYYAAARQTYAAAARQLERLRLDPRITAAVEQIDVEGYPDFPPAVILSLDETLLDNSRYHARLIEDDERYTAESWNEWVREEQSEAVPGAIEFTQQLRPLGIYPIYLTNRLAEFEEATWSNLEALGFPGRDQGAILIMRAERPEWDTSDKEGRRQYVAERFRVIMQLGDDLNDFIPQPHRSVEERMRITREYDGWWGERWFMLPNPQYGSWKGALIDYDYGQPREIVLQQKMQHLETGR